MKNIRHLRNKKDFKGKVALEELQRAHWIIVILAMALSFVLILEMFNAFQLDIVLGSIATTLLILVAAVSASIAIYLRSTDKK